jgi:hypothetical protein
MTATEFRKFVMKNYWPRREKVADRRWAWGRAVIDAQAYYEPLTHTYTQVANFLQKLKGIGDGEERMEVVGETEYLNFLDKYFPFRKMITMENE